MIIDSLEIKAATPAIYRPKYQISSNFIVLKRLNKAPEGRKRGGVGGCRRVSEGVGGCRIGVLGGRGKGGGGGGYDPDV